MKKQFKRIIAVLSAAVLLLLGCTPAYAASARWIQSGSRWWYRHSDSSYTRADWEKIGGYWYHFDSEGWMQTGWLKDKGKWYYLNTGGDMRTGWLKDRGKWYYLNTSGAMRTGWFRDKGKDYYLNPSDGSMLTGRRSIIEKKYSQYLDEYIDSLGYYYFDSSGAMQTGLHWINGSLYCYDDDGQMHTGPYTDKNGNHYYFNDYELDSKNYGKARIGWHDFAYYDKNGVRQYNTTVDGRYIDEYGVVRDEPGITLNKSYRSVTIRYANAANPTKSMSIYMMNREQEDYAALKSFFLALPVTDTQVPFENEANHTHPLYKVSFHYGNPDTNRIDSEDIYVYPYYGVARCEGVNYTVDMDAFEALMKECCY